VQGGVQGEGGMGGVLLREDQGLLLREELWRVEIEEYWCVLGRGMGQGSLCPECMGWLGRAVVVERGIRGREVAR
jgi:hypothetical protein